MLGSGHIDFNEFLVMMSQTKEKGHQAELRQAFRLFDSDGDGFITFDDLKRVMRNCGESLSDTELKNMFTKADINRDNLVDMKGKQMMLESACFITIETTAQLASPPRDTRGKVVPVRVPCAASSRLACLVVH